MRVVIDGDVCQGHQMCAILAPDLFGADDEGYGVVLAEGELNPAQLAAAERAVDSCPEEAISVVDSGAARVGERSELCETGPGPERPVAEGDESGRQPPGGLRNTANPLDS